MVGFIGFIAGFAFGAAIVMTAVNLLDDDIDENWSPVIACIVIAVLYSTLVIIKSL